MIVKSHIKNAKYAESLSCRLCEEVHRADEAIHLFIPSLRGSEATEAIHKDNTLVENIRIAKRFHRICKDSSDSIESGDKMDCHSPNGLRNDEQKRLSRFYFMDCHDLISSSLAMTIKGTSIQKTESQ